MGHIPWLFPTNTEYSVPQLKILLKEVEQIMEKKISLPEWQELS
jgi:hypothetical protein